MTAGEIVLTVACAIVGLIVTDIVVLFVAACAVRRDEYDKVNGFYRFIYLFHVRVAMFLSNIKLKVSGREKLKDISGGYLLIGNHRSNYDPFLTLIGLKNKNLAFISKPENFKVPFFGKIAKKCCYLAIDRENARAAIKTIIKASELIKNGVVSMAVYPEGTRDHGKELLPFHDGVFKIAQKADCPIVVAAISGTEKIVKRAPFLRTTVKLDILRVIPPEEVQSKTSHELSAETRSIMEKALTSL